MRLVVGTGVFSAALSRRRRPQFDEQVRQLSGNQLFLAAVTVAELRDGALVAEWGSSRTAQLEQAIHSTTVIPVSDGLLTTVAEFRLACRRVGHPLADRIHANDLWVAASTIHISASLLTADNVFDEAPGLTIVG